MDVGQVCISSAIAYYFKRQRSRHKFSVPDPRFVYKKAHQHRKHTHKKPKEKPTLNNRLKKHVKQNCHYNYFYLLREIQLLKQANK
jgi:hypothetical protein